MCDLLPAYEKRLPIIRRVAREFGYAIGLHGSGTRDLDLIAAPWTGTAHSAEELVDAICLAIHGVAETLPGLEQNPARRSHGRLAWSIQIGAGRYIDLSIMRRDETAHEDYAFGVCPVCKRSYYRSYGCEYCYAMSEARELDTA